MIEIINLSLPNPDFELPLISCKLANGIKYGILNEDGIGSDFLAQLAGVTSASEGEVRINGFDLLNQSILAKKQITYLPANYSPDPCMTVFEYLNWIADIYENRSRKRLSIIQSAMEFTGLDIYKDRLIRNLSSFDLPFLGLSQFLVSETEFLLLEIPSDFDGEEREIFFHLLNQLPEEKTLILTSDIPEELKKVCKVQLKLSDGAFCLEEYQPEEINEPDEDEMTSAEEIEEENKDTETEELQ